MVQPTIYEIEDYQTGTQYRVEAYEEGTTYDEAVEWFSSLPEQDRAQYQVQTEAPDLETIVQDKSATIAQDPEDYELGMDRFGDYSPEENQALTKRDEKIFLSMVNDSSVPLESLNAFLADRGKIPYSEAQLAQVAEGRASGTKYGQLKYFNPVAEMFDKEELNEEYAPEYDNYVAQTYRSVVEGWADPASLTNYLRRRGADLFDIYKEDVRKQFPDATPEQLNQLEDLYIAENARLRSIAAQEGVKDDALVPWLIGQFAALEPYDVIPIGKAASTASKAARFSDRVTTARRVAQTAGTGAGVAAAGDVAGQALAIDEGIQDEFDPIRTAVSAGLSAGIGGGAEFVGSAVRNLRSSGEPPQTVDIVSPSSKKGTKKYRAELREMTSQVDQEVQNIAGEWTNAPEFEVLPNFYRTKGASNTALGVYAADGRVLLNAERIAESAEARGLSANELTQSVMFHEALGHHGLTQKYGDELDFMLNKWYEEGRPEFQQKVADWLEANPKAYKTSPSNPRAEDSVWRRIRATEEVLAEWSERDGPMPAGLLDSFLNFVKQVGRDMGLDLRYSSRELRALLGNSQSNVIRGERTSETPGSTKNMESTSRNLEDLTADELIDAEDAFEILNNLTGKGETPSIDVSQIESEALNRGLQPSQITRWVGTQPGDLVRRLFMYDIAAEKLNTRLLDINKSIREKGLTEARQERYLHTMLTLDDLSSKIFQEQSELGRALNAMKKVNYTKRRVTAVRDALAESGLDGLMEPDAFYKLMDDIEAQQAKAKRKENGEMLWSALNVPRAIMSSFDLSAPFRQGIVFANRWNFWKSFVKMFSFLGPSGRANYEQMMSEIRGRDTHDAMVKAGLSFSEIGGKLSAREERFQTELAQKIPAIGTVVKQSEQTYSGFLNRLRADMFDQFLKAHQRSDPSKDFSNDVEYLRSLGRFINSATGRAELPGGLQSAAPQANAVFFSPRLIQSRVNMLANPKFYYQLDPKVRAEAMSSMISMGLIASMFTGTLAHFLDADVETDPRSSDFGKIKIGNTRFDLGGGFLQYITFGARTAAWLAGKDSVKTASGDTRAYGTDRFGQQRYADAAWQFFRNKLSPNASFVMDYMYEENSIGEPFTWTGSTMSRIVPMHLQAVAEAGEEMGYAKAALVTSPGIFGIGVNNYVSKTLDPNQTIDGPKDFEMQDLDDGENEQISVKDGVVTLKPEAQKLWEDTINNYFQTYIREDIANLELAWDEIDPAEQAEMIKEAKQDARAAAKEDMLYELGLD